MTITPADLPAQLGRWVTVTNPVHRSTWYGRLTALSDAPTLHLTLPGGQAVSLPQAFTVTGAEPPAPGVLAPPRQAAYDAVYDLIRLLGPKLPPDPVHRNAMIWRAVNLALDAAGVPVTADPADPTARTLLIPGDTVPPARDTVEDTAPDTGGHARALVPRDGPGDDLASDVPARPHPGDTGDASGDMGGDRAPGGVRFAYRAAVRRHQVHQAIAEAFDLLGAELAHQPEEGGGRDA